MICREYRHKEFICDCEPNFAEGDKEVEFTVRGKKVMAMPNHKDPRNEWSQTAAGLLEYHCSYCNTNMRPNPRAGEVEVIKNGKYGSWQTNVVGKKLQE